MYFEPPNILEIKQANEKLFVPNDRYMKYTAPKILFFTTKLGFFRSWPGWDLEGAKRFKKILVVKCLESLKI